MHQFDAKTTRQALGFDALIDALHAMFAAGCEVPQRHTHVINDPVDGTSGTVLIMPAWQTRRYLGIKTVSIYPSNAGRGLPGLFSTYMLYDAASGQPLAQIDGNEITSRRTAAASALAARYLAPRDASHLLVVGSGRVAALLPQAYRAVRPITEVTVWSRTAANAEALVREWESSGIRARVAMDLADAAAAADIVSCATLATEPVIQGAWLKPGAHLDLIGSFTPKMREADDACFADADLYMDTPEALQKSGEFLGPISRGVFQATDVRATLTDLCRAVTAPCDQPGAHGRRTVFKSVGTALEDLAAAILVVEANAR